MAKTNKKAIMELSQSINKKEGKGTVYTPDGKYVIEDLPRWSTGIEDLDYVLGGGMPEGRIVEISGFEGSGKTTLLYHLCSMHDVCLDIPIEGTFDLVRAKVFGNRKGQMLIYRAKYGEDAFNKVGQYAKLGIPLIGIDSVPSLVPKTDAEKIEKAIAKDSIEQQQMGGIARLMNVYLPVIEPILEVTGTTLIFINQMRDTIGALLFAKKTHTPGGKKKDHACSIKLEVARKAWIEIPNKNPKNSAVNKKIGFIMKVKCIKNKTAPPYRECELHCLFDYGFVSADEYLDLRKILMKEENERYNSRKRKVN